MNNTSTMIIEEVATIASNLLLQHFAGTTTDDQAKFKQALMASPELSTPTLFPVLGIMGIISLVMKVIGMIFPSASDKEKYSFLLAFQESLNQTTLAQGQNAINIVETELAKSSGSIWMQIFWAGFRPVAAWACTIFFIVQMINYAVSITANFFGYHIPVTPLENSTAYSMLGSLLGLGGLRTFEKYTKINQDK